MFSFIGKMLGSEKALEGVVNGVSSGLGKLIYSEQEKAEDAAADRAEARQMVVAWMAATSGQNIARRLIALAITSVWLGMFLIAQVASMVAVFWTTKMAALHQLSVIAKDAAGDMSGAVMLILGFYFAAPHMGKIAEAALGRFGKASAGPSAAAQAGDRTG